MAIEDCEKEAKESRTKIRTSSDPDFWRSRMEFYERKIEEIEDIL